MTAYAGRVAFADFTSEAPACRTQSELLLSFAGFLGKVGFDWFAYVSIGPAGNQAHASYPLEWQTQYVARSYMDVDPILKVGRKAAEAFGWASDDFASRGVQKRFFGAAGEFDVRSGVTVPLAGSYGQFTALSLANRQRSNDNGPALLAAFGGSITLASMYYHMHHDRVLELSRQQGLLPVNLLTNKQRACLSWIARGKTAEEAAAVLELAPVTVSWHLAKAKERLGAVTLPQAVALALHKGEIKL